MKDTKPVLALLLGLVVVGCSLKRDDPDLETELRSDIQKASQGMAQLTTLEITNGQNQNVHGVTVRILEFEAVVRLERPAVLAGGFARPYAARPPKTAAELAEIEAERQKARKNPQGGFLASVIPEYKETVTDAGTVIGLRGSAVFEMKDNGWDLVTMEVGRRKG